MSTTKKTRFPKEILIAQAKKIISRATLMPTSGDSEPHTIIEENSLTQADKRDK